MASPHKRLRLTSAAPHAHQIDAATSVPSSQKSRELWVDMFPPEVRERIVVHACRGIPGPVAIRLAQTSAALRSSVFSVLDNTMTCFENGARLTEMLCWVDLFGDDVVRIDFEGKPKGSSHPGVWYPDLIRLTAPLISAPNLRAVHVTDCLEHLAALCLSSSIVEVVIYCQGGASGVQVFNSLTNIRVQKLGTVCTACRILGRCPYSDPNAFGPNLNALATCCPFLKSLNVDCIASCVYQAGSARTMRHSVWEALPALGHLHELAVSKALSGSLVERLADDRLGVTMTDSALAPRVKRVFDSVKLQGIRAKVQGSPRVSVTELDTEDPKVNLTELDARVLMANQISCLPKCQGLRKVEFTVTKETEAAFSEAIRNLPELEKLHVYWQTEIVRGYEDYRDACHGVILSAVQRAKKLSDLHLIDVRIELSEMKAIMECVGLQLRKFRTSIFNQEESPLERLMALFQTAAKHNRELREFDVYDSLTSDDVCSPRKDRGRNQRRPLYQGDPVRRKQLVQQASSMLVRLKTNAPYLRPIFSSSWWYCTGSVGLQSVGIPCAHDLAEGA